MTAKLFTMTFRDLDRPGTHTRKFNPWNQKSLDNPVWGFAWEMDSNGFSIFDVKVIAEEEIND